MNKVFFQRAIPILLAGLLLWYVMKDVPIQEIGNQFRLANYGWLSVVGVLIGLFYVLRAARWQLTLQAIGYHPSLFRATVALLAGSLASMIVPGAGELTRCGTLQRTDGVPISQGIGSVVAERIVELFMLILVLLLTITLEFSRAKTYLSSLTLALARQNGYVSWRHTCYSSRVGDLASLEISGSAKTPVTYKGCTYSKRLRSGIYGHSATSQSGFIYCADHTNSSVRLAIYLCAVAHLR